MILRLRLLPWHYTDKKWRKKRERIKHEHCTAHNGHSDAVCGITVGFWRLLFRPFNEIIIITSVVSTAVIMLAFKQWDLFAIQSGQFQLSYDWKRCLSLGQHVEDTSCSCTFTQAEMTRTKIRITQNRKANLERMGGSTSKWEEKRQCKCSSSKITTVTYRITTFLQQEAEM